MKKISRFAQESRWKLQRKFCLTNLNFWILVKSKCFCGQSAPATKRCFDKNWSCGKPCRKKLACGKHTCPVPCHDGPCPPCDKKSVQLCLCQRNQKMLNCSEPQWQCEEKCGKKLGCGYHMCEVVCHEGPCPPCPLSQLRHCPCGKSTYQVSFNHLPHDVFQIKSLIFQENF